MCGIFGYIGKNEASPILINGLHLLEYRGYDSAGMAVLNGSINLVKAVGDVQTLQDKTKNIKLSGKCGIAHTRWATHGKVSEENAHPHLSHSERFVLVHNGIVENHTEIRKLLIETGYRFNGETDSEVLVNYIDYLVIKKELSMDNALMQVMKDLDGAYAFVLLDHLKPNHLFAVRQMSPLVVGVSSDNDEIFLSSDAQAFPSHVDKIHFIDNQSIIYLSKDKEPILTNKEGHRRSIVYSKIQHTASNSGLNGFSHYMHKEIFEQADIIGREMDFDPKSLIGDLAGLNDRINQYKRIIVLACGTSFHAGMIGRYLMERYTRIPVLVEYAAEFRYRHPVVGPDDLVIGISQSGETADTLAALRMAKAEGAFILCLCNVVESSMARESDAILYLNAGPEVGVASTKAFTTQVLQLMRLTAYITHQQGGLFPDKEIMNEMESIPSKIRTILSHESEISKLAQKFAHYKHFLFLGRGINYPIALEGALKLKEISYIHAEGYSASEMKHGPIALIDENFPVIAIACDTENRSKMISNIMEVKARNGIVIAVTIENDKEIAGLVDEVIEVPSASDVLIPLLSVIPLQLFAYHAALALNCNVDRPRNLAKAVTVE